MTVTTSDTGIGWRNIFIPQGSDYPDGIILSLKDPDTGVKTPYPLDGYGAELRIRYLDLLGTSRILVLTCTVNASTGEILWSATPSQTKVIAPNCTPEQMVAGEWQSLTRDKITTVNPKKLYPYTLELLNNGSEIRKMEGLTWVTEEVPDDA